jgi:hypothetical protein
MGKIVAKFVWDNSEEIDGLVPEGKNKAVLKNVEVKFTPKGHKNLSLIWKIKGYRRWIYDNIIITENTGWKITQLAKALGITDCKNGDECIIKEDDLKNAEVDVFIGQEPSYKDPDVLVNNIKYYIERKSNTDAGEEAKDVVAEVVTKIPAKDELPDVEEGDNEFDAFLDSE